MAFLCQAENIEKDCFKETTKKLTHHLEVQLEQVLTPLLWVLLARLQLEQKYIP